MQRSCLFLKIICAVCSTFILSGCPAIIAGGIAGTALIATDRRPTGIYIQDQNIELNAQSQIRTAIPQAHVNVTSFNRVAVMTGEVPSVKAQNQAELIVKGQPGLRRVFNHTSIEEASNFKSRGKDSAITAAVRTRLLDGKNVHPNHVKVITEKGVVYLLGLVTQAEGEAAAKLASETTGVQKVIVAFEFMEPKNP